MFNYRISVTLWKFLHMLELCFAFFFSATLLRVCFCIMAVDVFDVTVQRWLIF